MNKYNMFKVYIYVHFKLIFDQRIKGTDKLFFRVFKQLNLWGKKCSGDENISILHLSCRTSDLKLSQVLQTHALVF